VSHVVIVNEPPKVSARKRKRCHYMLHAYLTFHARKVPERAREVTAWLYLLGWARLGGKPDEVPT
jgi:hypothetical protein